MDMIGRILRSRGSQWQQPLTSARIKLPWAGQGTARIAVMSAVRKFMISLRGISSGPLPLFDTRTFRVRLDWTAARSLGSILRTAGAWANRQHERAWPCVCAARGAEWPRARSAADGSYHICASQEEVPWPSQHRWVATWSCKTKMRPRRHEILDSLRSSLLNIAALRRLETTPLVDSLVVDAVRAVSEAVEHDFRVLDVFNEQPSDSSRAMAAASFVRNFWVEITDHAAHKVQVICTALALSAIHKAWEYGAFAGGGHFTYATLADFGYRCVDDLLEDAATVHGLPDSLSPFRLGARGRAKWELGRARTLPKNSDPAAAHRPLCNRECYPTAVLDSVLCRAGVAGLRMLEVSEHLDIDNPKDAVREFERLRNQIDPEDSIIADAESDMKGCFTHIPSSGCIASLAPSSTSLI